MSPLGERIRMLSVGPDWTSVMVQVGAEVPVVPIIGLRDTEDTRKLIDAAKKAEPEGGLDWESRWTFFNDDDHDGKTQAAVEITFPTLGYECYLMFGRDWPMLDIILTAEGMMALVIDKRGVFTGNAVGIDPPTEHLRAFLASRDDKDS